MTNDDYITAIATIISDFRCAELPKPLDVSHVTRWVEQFAPEEQGIVVKETFHVLTRYYYKKDRIQTFLKQVLKKLSQKSDLSSLHFLQVQDTGYSQKKIIEFIKEIYETDYNLSCSICANIPLTDIGYYVYIDDGLYTGRRARSDLKEWISQIPPKSTLYVIFMIAYSNNYTYTASEISRLGKSNKIEVIFDCGHLFYNERNDHNVSMDFVWPHSLCRKDPIVAAYEAELLKTGKANYLFQVPTQEYKSGLFSTPSESRKMEYIFLKYGLAILENISQTYFKPLGLTWPPSFGFGSFLATDINISNTCPLVLWWGSITEETNPALACWYPLLPRRGNGVLLKSIIEHEEQFSISKYEDILRTVYRLALERYNEHTEHQAKNDNSVIDLSEIENRRDESELLQYLKVQSMDTIKVIETVMYIGRDYNPISEEEIERILEMHLDNPEYELPPVNLQVSNPTDLILTWMEDLGGVSGWKNKNLEVEQIYQKLPLYKYLRRAFRILGIHE